MSSLPSSQRGVSSPHDHEEDALNEVIMAIEMKDNNTVGCAYYVTFEKTMYLQEDIPMAGVEVIETLLLQAQPTSVIINNRAPAKMADFLEAHAQDLDGSTVGGAVNGVYILRTVVPADFSFEKGRQKLAALDSKIFGQQSTILTGVAETVDYEEDGGTDASRLSKYMRLSTVIDLESRLTIGCAGAVLNELQRRRVVEYLPDDPLGEVAFCVNRVTMFTLGNSMFVNADTLVSLQILGSEHHPNSQMQGPGKSGQGAKEDLSIYGLLKTLACTSQGKARLRQMLLRPSNDLDIIRKRHRSIAVLLRPENKPVLDEITKMLRKVKDIHGSLANLTKGVHQMSRTQGMRSGVWMTLSRFAHGAIELFGLVHNLSGAQSLDIVTQIVTCTNPRAIREVGEMISRDIDFERSAEAGRTTVKWGIDQHLDELKHLFAGLEDILSQVRSRLLYTIPEWARPHLVNCIFYPQLGFLAAINEGPQTGQGLYHGEGLVDDQWERMFTNDGIVCYKTRMMCEMDAAYGDPYGRLVDREIEIVHQLGVKVLEHAEALTTASDLFGELDSLIALAMAAERYHWTAPNITLSNSIDIREGRHPLQELVVPSFIANDCRVSGGHGQEAEVGTEAPASHQGKQVSPSMLILTGPNHSGKSVYLKQVALIVYLAHVGSYVPADYTTIGLTDKILTRISTRESMGRSESAFAIDLRQAAFSINHATHRSLVLVDEFGKGTNVTDGAGLMTALLYHFLSLGDARPKVLVATHFHEIFENNFLSEEDRDLWFAHMEVRLNPQASDSDEQVTYLFQLLPGRSTSSYGCRCAAINGVDEAVVERAEALALLLARNEDLQAACAKLAPAEETKLEEAEAIARRFVEMDIPVPQPRQGVRPGTDVESVRAMLGELLTSSRV